MSLERRTPLRRGGALPRGAGLARTGGLPARRAAPRRAGDRLEHGTSWEDVLALLHVRSAGCCEGCGKAGVPFEGHHRRTRRFGPDCPCNALLLCRDCHHDRAHGTPAAARARGWVLSRHGTEAPGMTPARLHGERTVFLSCEGDYT